MKKKLFIPIFVLIATAFSVCAAAVGQATVYSEKTECYAGKSEEVSIPVLIKDNPGVMGFLLTFHYPESAFCSSSVERGDLTERGSFADSITAETNGDFNVLWNDSSDMHGDGALFTLKLKIRDDAPAGEYTILVGYRQDDTFNEKWEDVFLKTENISVVIEDSAHTSQTYVVENTVSVSLENNGDNNEVTPPEVTSGAPEKDEDGDSTRIKSGKDLTGTESEENSGINQTVVKAVDDIMREMAVPDLGSLPEEKKAELKNRVNGKIKESADTGEELSFDEIAEIYRAAGDESTEATKDAAAAENTKVTGNLNEDTSRLRVIIISAIAGLLAIAVIAAIIMAGKKNNLL